MNRSPMRAYPERTLTCNRFRYCGRSTQQRMRLQGVWSRHRPDAVHVDRLAAFSAEFAMRERWARGAPQITLALGEVTELLRPAFARATAVASERIGGGLSNTNIKVTLAGRANPVVMRIYQRHTGDAAKEAALLRELSGRLPVPRLHYFSVDNPVTGHPYAILEWVGGERLDVLAGVGADLEAMGAAIGAALARIHAVAFDRYGFLGPSLEISHPIDLGQAGLTAYIRSALAEAPAGARLGGLTATLAAFAAERGHVLARWPGPCLVHGDFNGTNVLLGQSRLNPSESSSTCNARPPAWEVTAVLDWEFALSATPAFDFAQLLRPPLGGRPALAESAARSYRDAGQPIPEHWREIARVTDLFAWIDVVSRAEVDPALIDDARNAIRAIVAENHG